MSEVYVRVSDLREAAERMRQSAREIELSLNRVNTMTRELLAMGVTMPQLQAMHGAQVLHAQGALYDLQHLVQQLSRAAEDLEEATQHPRLLPRFQVELLPDDTPAALLQETPAPALLPGIVFVSSANRPLYDRLQARQADLAAGEARLNHLVAQRSATLDEYNALRNRLSSYDADLDLSQVPRLQAMEQQIGALDSEITQLNQDMAGWRSEAAQISERLQQVQPAPGADLDIIARLDGAATAPHIVNNTHDCVNHVVQQLPVPDGLPLDAHLWDDLAREHPEYGITLGDQPLEGAVLVMETEHSYADNQYGHLMYVESVVDGEVWVTDNNHPEAVRLSDLTSETSGENLTYLYFPWHTQG